MNYKSTIASIIFVFLGLMSFAQQDSEDKPCQAKRLNDFTQFADSMEFRLNCWTKIDFENDMCEWVLAEDYYNTVPRETSKLLCVIYFKNQLKTEEIEIIELFDNPKYREKYKSRIQLIYIYDPHSGYNEAFQGKKEIGKILSYEIRKGFENND